MAEGGRGAPRDARSTLALPLGIVVASIWSTAAIVGFLTGTYTGLEVVSPVMMVCVGYVFGINIVRTGERAESASRQASGGTKRTPTRRS